MYINDYYCIGKLYMNIHIWIESVLFEFFVIYNMFGTIFAFFAIW